MTAHAPSSSGDRETDARSADLRFVTRGVTHDEAAAVTAVILAALDEQSGGDHAAEPGRDPWVRSGNAIRRPVEVGPGSWVRAAR